MTLAAGSVTTTRRPCGSRASAMAVPPIQVTSCATTNSPMPVPEASRWFDPER